MRAAFSKRDAAAAGSVPADRRMQDGQIFQQGVPEALQGVI